MKSHRKKMFRIKGAVIAALSIYASGAILFSSARAESPREDQTRYGVASGSGPLNTLLINGHPTTPRIAGNSALFVAKIAEAGNADILLLTSVGGQACDAQYAIVQVTPTGIKPPTAFFGNCISVRPMISGQTITMKFPRNVGRYATIPAEIDTYDIATGQMTKNGKPVSAVCRLDNGVCQG